MMRLANRISSMQMIPAVFGLVGILSGLILIVIAYIHPHISQQGRLVRVSSLGRRGLSRCSY